MKLQDTNNKPVKSTQHSPDTSKSGTEVGVAGTNNSRRHLLKKISATAPVVMAVSSKPALANFCTVSGLMSGNLSSQNDLDGCGGISPGGYKENPNRSARTDPFLNVFGALWHGEDNPGNGEYTWPDDITFAEVLSLGGNKDRYEFGAHVVAAYINAKEIPGYGQTPDDVVRITREIIDNGSYVIPGTNGSTIDAEGYVDFIQQTFH